MTPGRLPHSIGTFSTLTPPRKTRNGSWRTTVRYYGAWGTQYIERTGSSPGEARNRLAEAIRDFREETGESRITRTTTLMTLAAELALVGCKRPAAARSTGPRWWDRGVSGRSSQGFA